MRRDYQWFDRGFAGDEKGAKRVNPYFCETSSEFVLSRPTVIVSAARRITVPTREFSLKTALTVIITSCYNRQIVSGVLLLSYSFFVTYHFKHIGKFCKNILYVNIQIKINLKNKKTFGET